MKKIALGVLLFFPIMSFAQAKTYATIRAVDFSYSHSDPAFGGMFSVGGKGSIIGIGAGVGAIKLKDANSIYMPVFGEVTAFGSPKDIGPYFTMQVGYGIFQNQQYGVDESGGLYLSPTAGFLLPIKKNSALLITGGYISSEFKVKTNTGYTRSSISETSHGFSLGVGFKF